MTYLSTDRIDILLGADGDLDLTGPGGVPQWSTGSSGVAQACQVVMGLIAGEWFLDLDAGIKYLERDGVTAEEALFGQRFDEGKTIAMFTDALNAVPGVDSVVAVTPTFDNKTRVLVVQWTVKTVLGDTISDVLSKGA